MFCDSQTSINVSLESETYNIFKNMKAFIGILFLVLALQASALIAKNPDVSCMDGADA